MKLKPTLAPIWFPHWPAWMWTISLMVRCGCGQSWVRSSVRDPANQHLTHLSDGCGAADIHAAGRMTWRAASQYPSQPIGASRFDAVAQESCCIILYPDRPLKTKPNPSSTLSFTSIHFDTFFFIFCWKWVRQPIHWSINSGLFYQYMAYIQVHYVKTKKKPKN